MTNQCNYTVESENTEGQEASLFDYISLTETKQEFVLNTTSRRSREMSVCKNLNFCSQQKKAVSKRGGVVSAVLCRISQSWPVSLTVSLKCKWTNCGKKQVFTKLLHPGTEYLSGLASGLFTHFKSQTVHKWSQTLWHSIFLYRMFYILLKKTKTSCYASISGHFRCLGWDTI